MSTRRLHVTYVVPLRTQPQTNVDDLARYLRRLAHDVDEVVVVDGSTPDVVREHRAAFGDTVSVVVPERRTLNGKVGNVDTGIRRARHELVVLADDDVRYELAQLHAVAALLDDADVVRPQNYFSSWPWHARVDCARTLLNRMFGGDWPGTLAVRRSAYVRAGGYAGDVLFENLELVRTIRAHGGHDRLALDLLVARRPPTVRHFRGQQVRQAYDELARPARLAMFLVALPITARATFTRRFGALAAASVVVGAIAESGRRRAGGRTVFPATSTLVAPAWVLWRSACSWAALVARFRGGVRYADQRIVRAASGLRQLRQTCYEGSDPSPRR
jgi:hypothetical protein